MGQQFRTSAETMQAASTHIADVNASVTGTLSSLRSTAEGSRASWEGAAATAFTGLMTRWDEDSRKLNQALAEISELIAQNATNYTVTDTSGVDALKSAGSGLQM